MGRIEAIGHSDDNIELSLVRIPNDCKTRTFRAFLKFILFIDFFSTLSYNFFELLTMVYVVVWLKPVVFGGTGATGGSRRVSP